MKRIKINLNNCIYQYEENVAKITATFRNKNKIKIFINYTGEIFIKVYRKNDCVNTKNKATYVDIPLLEERFRIVQDVAKTVNTKMDGNFYGYIEGLTVDKDIFSIMLENFSSFEDTREYQGKTIYFYKLAQLLTSDILHVIEIKEQTKVDYSNLVGCADYKIPQVMH